MELVRAIYSNGGFEAQRTMQYVGMLLAVSWATIYNPLVNLRKQDANA